MKVSASQRRLRRVALGLAGLAILVAVLWFFGRAPSTYVLEQECARFQQERRVKDAILRRRIGVVEGAERKRLEGEYHALLRDFKTLETRGWEIVLLPEGGRRPPTTGFLDAGGIIVAIPTDPPTLHGRMQVWYAPRGTLARLTAWFGVAGTPRLADKRN